jgi:hypothetical protein
MNNKLLIAALLSTGISMTAQAGPITVGGVTWDTDSTFGTASLNDFAASGSVLESVVQNPGDILNGYGNMNSLNSGIPNAGLFCPGCELTYTFTATLVGFTPSAGVQPGPGVNGDFEFSNLVIQFWVDDLVVGTNGTDPFDQTNALTAGDGTLWLQLSSDLLSGSGDNLGSGSDNGSGSSLLNVSGGLAAANFDTNGEAGGTDFRLSSDFGVGPASGLLQGSFNLYGDSVAVPEPSSIALLGLGMLGLAFGARRKSVK